MNIFKVQFLYIQINLSLHHRWTYVFRWAVFSMVQPKMKYHIEKDDEDIIAAELKHVNHVSRSLKLYKDKYRDVLKKLIQLPNVWMLI